MIATLLVAALGAAAADAPPVRRALLILSPAENETLSGPSWLRAGFAPEGLEAEVGEVAFSVDGVPACRAEAPGWECEFDAGAEIRPRLVRAVASLRGGGRLVSARRTPSVDLTLAVDVDLVQVTATVSDSRGRLVRGLGPADFRVFEDEAPQEVSHFVPPDEPREVVVAVDMSGSMGEAMPRVREAVKGFLTALRADDRVTLLAFNDGIFTLARREGDRAARERAVQRLSAWGGTALHDVILKGQELLARTKGRKALVVFSDGKDESSRATVEDVERRAERSDTPVYMIGQGQGTKEPDLRRMLDRLARTSGGRAFYTEQPEELRGVFETILDELRSQYVFAYASSRTETDGAWRAIRVEAGSGRHVRARQGYRAERR